MIDLDGKVSIIMPGYNEGEKIFNNLVEVNQVLSSMLSDFEILFINDGSKDNTLEMAKKAEFICEKIKIINLNINCGKGNALREGTSAAEGNYIVFLDSDLDLHPSQLPLFFETMLSQNADVVIGSKLHPGSETTYPFSRKIISIGYYFFLVILFQLKTRDTQTGIKLFKSNVIKPVMRKILVKRFAFDIEVLSIINKLGYKIVECPVVLKFSRKQGWGRIKFQDIRDVFIDTLAIFYRLNILNYYDLDKIRFNDQVDKVTLEK